jgi:hypothetical protein
MLYPVKNISVKSAMMLAAMSVDALKQHGGH